MLERKLDESWNTSFSVNIPKDQVDEIEGKDEKLYPEQIGNTYYYDPKTGLMAKGEVEIEGKIYYFDEVTGVLQ